MDGGKPAGSVDKCAPEQSDIETSGVAPEPTDLALAALAGAQRMARTHPSGSPGRSARTRRRRTVGADARDATAAGSPRGGYSGPSPDDTDPQPLGTVLAGYVGARGWERPLAEARVFADWHSLVGADVAAHCIPAQLRDGELRIAAESTAWATQLRLLAATLLARLAGELGPDVVRKVVVSGPVGPSWRHGPRTVHGARGPRDTYG